MEGFRWQIFTSLIIKCISQFQFGSLELILGAVKNTKMESGFTN